MLTVEDIRDYCLSKAQATEDFPFDDTYLAFRVGGKIFAGLPLEKHGVVQLKCDPMLFDEVLAQHPYVSQAWHWHKRHWIQLNLNDEPPSQEVYRLIDHAYEVVVGKLTKKLRKELNL